MNSVTSGLQLLQTPAAAGGDSMIFTFVVFGAVFLIFYLMIIRPQNKKQKETQKMIEALKKGDKVQTIGGIRGTVFSVKEDSIIVKVDDNTKMEFVRNAVATVLEQKPAADAEKPAEETEAASDSKEK